MQCSYFSFTFYFQYKLIFFSSHGLIMHWILYLYTYIHSGLLLSAHRVVLYVLHCTENGIIICFPVCIIFFFLCNLRSVSVFHRGEAFIVLCLILHEGLELNHYYFAQLIFMPDYSTRKTCCGCITIMLCNALLTYFFL